MSTRDNALAFLRDEIEKREKRTTLNFEEYWELVRQEPRRVLRNIFQLFYDMVKESVTKKADEYPDDPESIGFVKYDCSKLFVEGSDSPFFADTLFANRFIGQVDSLLQGFQQNRIYVYEGTSGAGKSTFLNNLLRSFESYTGTREGQIFEIFWEIDENLFPEGKKDSTKLVVPCPSHDYPLLVIPKEQRIDFLRRLLAGNDEFLSAIITEKTYEWLTRGETCTICKSIFWSSLDKLGSLDRVLGMVKVRPYRFARSSGEGISIFNPGDKPMMVSGPNSGPVGVYFTNPHIQEILDRIFGPQAVRYMSSSLAKTNNGIYVLMDVKAHNRERLVELHNVISEGVHKVGDIEEHINTLFFALMNPEDKTIFKDEKMESLEGRIQYNRIPFVLVPETELSIWHSIFGESVDGRFLPRVLMNLARVIVSSRMNIECEALSEWIPDVKKYSRYCDENGLLLRMEIYGGIIPEWLSEEDRRNFTAPKRRALIEEGVKEGGKGFSGRDSARLFSEFFRRYGGRQGLIGMNHVIDFFKHRISRDVRNDNLPPKGFLDSLVDSYDYAVLSEIKESLYEYNETQIMNDILNYLCAIDYDLGSKVMCPYTSQEVDITIEFLKLMAGRLSGRSATDQEAMGFAQEMQKKHTTVRAKEGLNIKETDFYRDLFKAYRRNLKERVLQPFVGNANFREAVKAFGTPDFEAFDTRLREHVTHMIENLMQKFDYTQQGAKEICIYALDKDLPKKFS